MKPNLLPRLFKSKNASELHGDASFHFSPFLNRLQPLPPQLQRRGATEGKILLHSNFPPGKYPEAIEQKTRWIRSSMASSFFCSSARLLRNFLFFPQQFSQRSRGSGSRPEFFLEKTRFGVIAIGCRSDGSIRVQMLRCPISNCSIYGAEIKHFRFYLFDDGLSRKRSERASNELFVTALKMLTDQPTKRG